MKKPEPFRDCWKRQENGMNWMTPIVEEICVGMEVTSYDSADIAVEF